jgi:hypothetical protein
MVEKKGGVARRSDVGTALEKNIVAFRELYFGQRNLYTYLLLIDYIEGDPTERWVHQWHAGIYAAILAVMGALLLDLIILSLCFASCFRLYDCTIGFCFTFVLRLDASRPLVVC